MFHLGGEDLDERNNRILDEVFEAVQSGTEQEGVPKDTLLHYSNFIIKWFIFKKIVLFL